MSNITNGDFSPLFVQSPEMNTPFDTGTYYPDNDSSGKYAIKVSMDNIETNKPMKAFHSMLSTMDNHLIEKAVENSAEWFKPGLQWLKKKGDVRSKEEKIRDIYTTMVKVSTDAETGEPNGKWAPSFGFKIVKRDGKVMCDCYDASKSPMVTDGDEAVNLEQMFKKGTKVKMILKCNGLWISNVGWGCTWRAEQIKIDTPVGFSGYAFDDSDDEGGVELTRTSTEAVVKPADNFVESDEGEDEDGDEDGDEGEDEGEDSGEEQKVVKRVVKKAN